MTSPLLETILLVEYISPILPLNLVSLTVRFALDKIAPANCAVFFSNEESAILPFSRKSTAPAFLAELASKVEPAIFPSFSNAIAPAYKSALLLLKMESVTLHSPCACNAPELLAAFPSNSELDIIPTSSQQTAPPRAAVLL